MKILLKAEELFLLILSIYLFYANHFNLIFYAIFFFVPDLSWIGYAINPRVGAITYNIVHNRVLAIVLFILGSILSSHALLVSGLVLFGHISFDRMLGYGLKYSDSFQNTHLGRIGKK